MKIFSFCIEMKMENKVKTGDELYSSYVDWSLLLGVLKRYNGIEIC